MSILYHPKVLRYFITWLPPSKENLNQTLSSPTSKVKVSTNNVQPYNAASHPSWMPKWAHPIASERHAPPTSISNTKTCSLSGITWTTLMLNNSDLFDSAISTVYKEMGLTIDRGASGFDRPLEETMSSLLTRLLLEQLFHGVIDG